MNNSGPRQTRRFFPRDAEHGQVLLVVVLVMVVILTVGLSVAARNVTNLRQSSDEEHSQRAFSAAEAGVQIALKQESDVTNPSFNGETAYRAVITRPTDREFPVNGGAVIPANEAADIWLSNYPTYASKWSGSLRVYWGTSSTACNNAALEVVVLSGANPSAPIVTQYAFDPCSSHGNRFSTPGAGATVAGITYRHGATIPVTNGIMARVVPLYNSTVMAVQAPGANPALPAQGTRIESTGSSGGTQRKIVVFQAYPKLPLEFFPYTIFTAQ